MKNKYNMVVACVASGIAIAPFLAYRLRPASLLDEGSLDEWFVSTLRGGDGLQTFRWTTIACAAAGIAVGMFLRRILQSVDDKQEFKLTLLRTPLAAAILVPLGIASILFIAYNHSSEVFEGIVWPDFYFKNWLLFSAIFAFTAAVLIGILNILEHAFDQSNILARAGILCCSPFAILIGFLSMAGMIGFGLLCGVGVGRLYECPITAAWAGACIAVVVLAVEGGIFWPVYFPMTRHAVE